MVTFCISKAWRSLAFLTLVASLLWPQTSHAEACGVLGRLLFNEASSEGLSKFQEVVQGAPQKILRLEGKDGQVKHVVLAAVESRKAARAMQWEVQALGTNVRADKIPVANLKGRAKEWLCNAAGNCVMAAIIPLHVAMFRSMSNAYSGMLTMGMFFTGTFLKVAGQSETMPRFETINITQKANAKDVQRSIRDFVRLIPNKEFRWVDYSLSERFLARLIKDTHIPAERYFRHEVGAMMFHGEMPASFPAKLGGWRVREVTRAELDQHLSSTTQVSSRPSAGALE